MTEIYNDPTKRHDFVFLFDVKNGNPNGDPDAGNLPRIDPITRHGIVTDVCIKRKIRDYVSVILGKPIFIQSEYALNTLIYRAAKEIGVEPPTVIIKDEDEDLITWFKEHPIDDFEIDKNELRFTGEKYNQKNVKAALLKDVDNDDMKKKINAIVKQLSDSSKGKKIGPDEKKLTKEKMIETYFDIRMFGAVLSTGLNAGQVRGPMQITFARSIDPIFPMDITITRVAITKEEDKARKQTEMGRKPFIGYGLYRAHGFYNPYLANKVTEDDLKDFWEALKEMFEHDHSASRGEMHTQGLWVFSHNSNKGDAPSHKLFDLIKIDPFGEYPSKYEDYQMKINSPVNEVLESNYKLETEKYPKVTLNRLV